jgi:hypothetical protein
MAYDKQDLITKSLAAIKKHKLIFIDEVVSYLPCSVSTSLNVALYKLCASDEEIDKLSTNKTKITDGNGDPFKIILVDASKAGNDTKD